ncbi:MAG: gliding motility-associated C-terminal domain-containing protein [Cryomorphaceae bacterium]|nr:gliding motility-associated C-terminal domain-containing protein [Cryomorphaceae bacterium]
MKRIYGILFIFLLTPWISNATHNRAGEITYRHLSGSNYEVTITTYTKTSAPADRCELEIFWGDNTSAFLPRINGPTAGNCAPNGMGETLANDVKKNIYRGVHAYPSPGTFTISTQDPNRNQGISNIPNSVNVVFYLQTTIIINPILGNNSSPELLNPPIDDGCVGKLFVHNAAAFDPDGDSLAYRLVDVRGVNGMPFGTTYDPSFVQDPVTIDSITGDLIWNTPQVQGQFNFAIEILEYRKSSSNVYALMSRVTRDLQVTIIGGCNNDPPEITPAGPFCVVAGDTLNFSMTATDPNGHQVSLTATGGPFEIDVPAFLTGPISGVGSVTREFTWRTNCSHVRQQNYFVYFRAEDNPPGQQTALTAYQTVQIRVISPGPRDPLAIGSAVGIELSWDPSVCEGPVRYDIYRREDPSGWTPDSCETGVPGYTGFEKIAQVNGVNNTFYTDDEVETVGFVYCYRIVAVFPDGGESIASDEVCAELPKTLPVMTNVDVEETDSLNGEINVAWTRPYEIDSLLFPPPYRYELYRAVGIEGENFTLIETKNDLFDTAYTDTGLNTRDSLYRYKVDFLLMPSETKVGASYPATQPFLLPRGSNGRITLSYQFDGPWRNDTMVVFREIPQLSGNFDSIGFSTSRTFTDTGLVNGQEYCYYIRTNGNYPASGLPENLRNRSQIACGLALDTTRPCAPIVFNDFKCPDNKLELFFSDNPNPDCPDHTFLYYNIYYKAKLDDDYPETPTFSNIQDSIFERFELPFSGCYKVTVVKRNEEDPSGLARESPFSEEFCVDPCPDIIIPNVFTPNGDGRNDVFRPVPDPRDINFIEIKIFNRWGNMVYRSESTEQFINEGWDGNDMETGKPSAAGVYFYVMRIIYRGLTPQDEINLNGDIHLYR